MPRGRAGTKAIKRRERAHAFHSSAFSMIADRQLSLPGFIFRGQILSITLAAVLIGFVLLREWITQHNWAEHVPRPAEKEAEINPHEWTVRRGVAYRNEELVEAVKNMVQQGKVERSGFEELLQKDPGRLQGIDELLAHLASVTRDHGPGLAPPHGTNSDVARIEAALTQAKEAKKEREGRIEMQRKMAVWQPIVGAENRLLSDAPATTPITSKDNSVSLPSVTENNSASLPYVTATSRSTSPPRTSPSRHSSFSLDEAPAGPSRLPTLTPSPSQSPKPSDPLAMFSTATQPAPERSFSPPLLSPGGTPRPAAPPKAVAGVAYTAPEMLSEKGKGKARAADDEEGGGDLDGSLDLTSSGGEDMKRLQPDLHHPPAQSVDIPDSAVATDGGRLTVDIDAILQSDGQVLSSPDRPPDYAYRDTGYSSGRHSPSTALDRTVPASRDDRGPGSPVVEALVVDGDGPQRQAEVVGHVPAIIGAENHPEDAGEVIVQFLPDEEEEAHWEREDWEGVLEGGYSADV